MKVVLAVKDTELLRLIGHGLRREGLAVVLAHDGERALAAWRMEHPAVVVAGLDLPRLRWDELCRRIRESAPTGVILLGERDERAALAARTAGRGGRRRGVASAGRV